MRKRSTFKRLGFREFCFNPDFKPVEFEGFGNQTGIECPVRHDMWVAHRSREFYYVPYGTKCCTPFPSCYPHSIPTGFGAQFESDGTFRNGNPKPDSSLRDYERIPLGTDIDQYYQREVQPHLPNSRMDRSKDKTGYEINFTKYFYIYKPMRSVEEIAKDLLELEKESEGLMKKLLI